MNGVQPANEWEGDSELPDESVLARAVLQVKAKTRQEIARSSGKSQGFAQITDAAAASLLMPLRYSPPPAA